MKIKSFSEFSLSKVIKINIINIFIYLFLIYLFSNDMILYLYVGFLLLFLGPFHLACLTTILCAIIPLFINPFEKFSDNLKLFITLIILNLIVSIYYFSFTKSFLISFIYLFFSIGAIIASISIKHSNIKINNIKSKTI